MSLAYNGIGRAYANRRDYQQAERYYKQAAECDPGWCYPYANLGGVYLQNRDYNNAEIYYQKAISVAPDKPSLHYQLAQLYDTVRRYCDAVGEYRKAVSTPRIDSEVGFNVERVHRRISQLEQGCN
jgi:tetratricopeptide (TPR) repeat protein